MIGCKCVFHLSFHHPAIFVIASIEDDLRRTMANERNEAPNGHNTSVQGYSPGLRKDMAFQGLKKYWALPIIIVALILLGIADVATEPVASLQDAFWNFGEIQYGDSVTREFEITNTGQDELKISNEKKTQSYDVSKCQECSLFVPLGKNHSTPPGKLGGSCTFPKQVGQD